jgi:DNA repair photolyase
MYKWITHTLNPVRGECPYQCSYCFVRRWGKQNPLRLDEKDLRANLGEGNFIFVCSGCDLFHPDVPEEWIISVLSHTGQFPKNKYLLHTKNPERAVSFSGWYDNSHTLCVTIETNRIYKGISKAPPPLERAQTLEAFDGKKMITIEPVMDFDPVPFAELVRLCNPAQVNIGADSGNNRLPEPGPEKIGWLIEALRPYTKIALKDNLKRLYPEGNYD